MFEILMMLTLLVTVLSQLLPEEDDTDSEMTYRKEHRRNHPWRSKRERASAISVSHPANQAFRNWA